MFTIGHLRVHLIAESYTHVDAGGTFGLVPRVLYKKYVEPDADNLVPMVQHSLLIQSGERNIVVDTGHGDRLDQKARAILRHSQPRGTLTDSLARLGVSANDVHLVVDTHLHGDHCSGNLRRDEDGQRVPTFPNAEYVVQRREYEDAMRPNERTRATYHPDNYQPLVESGQMRLLDTPPHERVELASGVYGVVTSGHTPGHMSVWLESDGQAALFTCDMASYAVHFERLGWMTAYDVEPLITLETKRRWRAWALETGVLLIFPHDTLRPAGYWRGEAGLEVVGVEYA